MPWGLAFVAVFGSTYAAYDLAHTDPTRLGIGEVDLTMTTLLFISAPAEVGASLLSVTCLESPYHESRCVRESLCLPCDFLRRCFRVRGIRMDIGAGPSLDPSLDHIQCKGKWFVATSSLIGPPEGRSFRKCS